ncbi:MAG: ABC transporter permease subunit, partial [Gammaproteobacteria bacterium]
MSTIASAMTTGQRRLPGRSPNATILFVLATLISLPLLVVVFSVFNPAPEIWRHLLDTVLSEYILNSIKLMLGVGLLSLILGVVPAWLTTMFRFPFSKQLEWALLLPLAMPAYIIAYTYTGGLDASGPIQTLIRELTGWGFRDYWFPEIRSMGGAITMLAFVLYPYIYLITRAAFINQSVCSLEAARTLGCGPWKVFFRIALPLARPGIIVGLSLVLMETLADYGTVQYFGISAFTTGIFRTWFGLGNSAAAAQLSALLMVFVAVLVYVEYWSRQKQRYHHISTRFSSLVQKPLHGYQAEIATLVCSLPELAGFNYPEYSQVHWAWLTSGEVSHSATLSRTWHS